MKNLKYLFFKGKKKILGFLFKKKNMVRKIWVFETKIEKQYQMASNLVVFWLKWHGDFFFFFFWLYHIRGCPVQKRLGYGRIWNWILQYDVVWSLLLGIKRFNIAIFERGDFVIFRFISKLPQILVITWREHCTIICLNGNSPI